MVYIIGMHTGHNSSACLLHDGRIVACAQEERFSRIKNHVGFPAMAVNFIMQSAGITPLDLDSVVLGSRRPRRNSVSQNEMNAFYTHCRDSWLSRLTHKYRSSSYSKWLADTALRVHDRYYSRFIYPHAKENQINEISRALESLDENKIDSIDHHIAHSYAAYYGVARGKTDDCLVMTHDGSGDETCATIHEVNVSDRWHPISSTQNFSSLAALYAHVTLLLGMKRIEHEYKVMGLAPYADRVGAERVYDEVFKDLVKIDADLRIVTKVDSDYFYDYLREKLFDRKLRKRELTYRFDCIAGALQRLTEEVLVEWVNTTLDRAKISNVALGGGVFMNVKANMEIMYRTPVERLYICPSAGDESTAIGAAYWGYRLWCENNSRSFDPQPLAHLYLGPSYTEEEILDAVKRERAREKYKVEVVKDIEGHVAELLAKGKIVARFSGRMEFGARALGNRSILADPSNTTLVRELNEQVKQRDFWMPFAPTILKERQHDYIVNPKEIEAPYMVLAFNTKPLACKELKAGLHPYDRTCRPQILERKMNDPYYELIEHFQDTTGIGGVLNTSFNLHGEAVVCSPMDAIWTLENSGLRYLALENYLISKR